MADGIKIGNLDISAFKVGSDDCKVYLGDALLYPSVETRVVAKYNVTDTSNPTQIGYYNYIRGFSEIEIDGVIQPNVVSAYTFSTTGEHTVKYTLTDQTSIGDYVFYGCSSLTNIDIPNSITSIGNMAFNGCSGLTSINIPSGVTSIGYSAFQSCKSLTNIDIPSGVTGIDSGTFYSCSGLLNIVIPDSVTTIGQQALYNCSSLTSCTIGSGVTSIDFMAFASCNSLTSITCLAVTPPSLDTNVFFSTNSCPIYVPSGSVNAYKTASSWSSYTSRIQAIQ